MTRDEAIGSNVRQARLDRGLTALAVGSDMRTVYGHLWDNSTVGKVESGRRTLRLVEALDLAAYFGHGCSVDDFTKGL